MLVSHTHMSPEDVIGLFFLVEALILLGWALCSFCIYRGMASLLTGRAKAA